MKMYVVETLPDGRGRVINRRDCKFSGAGFLPMPREQAEREATARNAWAAERGIEHVEQCACGQHNAEAFHHGP